MRLRASDSAVEVWAPAKLNLFLEVLGRREDGFHEIETLMCPVTLYDTLYFRPTEGSGQEISVTCDWAGPSAARLPGNHVPTDAANSAVRAVLLLRERGGIEGGAAMRLVKRIPTTAGLGGGSSDAAAALLAANEVWQLGLSREKLAEVGAELGSDVPFFLAGGAAMGRGRGERIERLSCLAPLHFVVIRPPQGLSTAAVYARCQVPREPRAAAPLVEALKRGDTRRLRTLVFNRLEGAADTLSPWVERVRRELARHDCLAHEMTGSGTAWFGICRHARHARRVAGRLQGRGLGQVYSVCSSP
jgi:4-diphosphocytidyl-2-C-methyl-D-erythritol kinase